ncbi:MAG: DUF2249 domain-containing protein [Gemmatimonadota bacterium]
MSHRITADDRVADVIARDEGLIDVFESVSPAFRRLRNPAMRKVMARLATVAQAARVAGVDEAELLARLNGAGSSSTSNAGPGRIPETGGYMADERPEALQAIDEEKVIELDVREDLRQGKEPFSRIMAAKQEVPAGGALRLRAIFEPAPLYAVLAKQGFRHHTEQHGEGDWVVWFWREAGDDAAAGERTGQPAEEEAGASVPGGTGGASAADGVVVLDVRGLEPPEPMVRTLAALDTLPRDHTLVQINVREPKFLLPQLAERGFEYEVREQAEDLVRVFIRRAGDE